MDLQEALLGSIMRRVGERCAAELTLLGAEVARPFYTYPTGDGLTRGVDLLFRGVEITSGGQRVHEHDVLVGELEKRGMDPHRFEGYLEVFKHGMPPHGGFAIGAERLTALLLGIPNVRFARAFPRDGSRLQP